MVKTASIYIGNIHGTTVRSIVEISSDEECVTLPSRDTDNVEIAYLGFCQNKDNRTEYEAWYDAYYHSYYPERYAVACEVALSPNVKRIVIPATMTHISVLAFQNVKEMQFEIDQANEVYAVKDGKIVEKETGKIIWPYRE